MTTKTTFDATAGGQARSILHTIIDDLEKELETALKCSHELCLRLGPVLKDFGNDSPEGAPPTRDGESQIATRLLELTERIANLHGFIRRLVDSTQV